MLPTKTLQNPQQPTCKLTFWNMSFWKQTTCREFSFNMDLRLTGLAFSSLGQWWSVPTGHLGHSSAQCKGCSYRFRSLRYISTVSLPVLSQPAFQPFFISVVLLWSPHVLFPSGSPRVNTIFLANSLRLRSFIAFQVWRYYKLAIVKWICNFESRNLNS